TDADIFLVLRVFAPDLKEVVFQGALDPHTPIGQGWLRASHRKLDQKLTLPFRPITRTMKSSRSTRARSMSSTSRSSRPVSRVLRAPASGLASAGTITSTPAARAHGFPT